MVKAGTYLTLRMLACTHTSWPPRVPSALLTRPLSTSSEIDTSYSTSKNRGGSAFMFWCVTSASLFTTLKLSTWLNASRKRNVYLSFLSSASFFPQHGETGRCFLTVMISRTAACWNRPDLHKVRTQV